MIYEHIIWYHGQISISWGGSAHFELFMLNPCRTHAEPVPNPVFFAWYERHRQRSIDDVDIMWYHVQQVVEKLCRTLHDEPLCRTLCRTLFCYVFLTWYGSHTQRIMVYVKIMWYHGQNPINYVQSKLRGPVCDFFWQMSNCRKTITNKGQGI